MCTSIVYPLPGRGFLLPIHVRLAVYMRIGRVRVRQERDTVRCTLNRSITRRSADPLGACIVLRSSGGREDRRRRKTRACPGSGTVVSPSVSPPPPPLSFRFVFDRFYRFCAGPHTPGARCVSRRADLSSFPEYYHFFNVSRGRDRPVNAAARAAVRETRIHIYNVLPYYGVPLLNGAHGARTASERPRNRAVRALERLWT